MNMLTMNTVLLWNIYLNFCVIMMCQLCQASSKKKKKKKPLSNTVLMLFWTSAPQVMRTNLSIRYYNQATSGKQQKPPKIMYIFSFNKVAFAQVFAEKLGIIFKLEDNMIERFRTIKINPTQLPLWLSWIWIPKSNHKGLDFVAPI